MKDGTCMTNASQTPPNIPGGVSPQDIFTILGLQDLPEEEKKALLGKLEQVIQERAIHMIVSQLTDDQCKDLNDKMDQGMDQTQVIEYLRGTIPGLDDRIRNLVEEFRDELLLEVDDIRQEIASGKTPSTIPVKQRQQLQIQIGTLKKRLEDIETQMRQAHHQGNQQLFDSLQEERKKTFEMIQRAEKQLG